jgi:guanylate kinase
MIQHKPVPILIAGPSGVGKSTIINRVAEVFPQLETFKTTTTRPPRHNSDDRYHFVSRDEFNLMIKNNEFLEWAEVHGNLYGAERKVVEDILAQGRYPLPINAVDIVGVRAYKKIFPSLLAIFIAYDSLDELPDRIRRTRPETTEEEIAKRMESAHKEMSVINEFDYVVYNHEGKIDEATNEVVRIITETLDLQPINR